MSVLTKTAKIAVASLLLAAGLGGSAVATAFGAASINSLSLLPQSVRDAANVEAQLPSDYSIIPEDFGKDATTEVKKPLLAALVERNSADSAVDSEEKCLASAIFYEARSESFEGQLAVAQVILNRVRHPAYPDTICGVVYQGTERNDTLCQLTFGCDGAMARVPS